MMDEKGDDIVRVRAGQGKRKKSEAEILENATKHAARAKANLAVKAKAASLLGETTPTTAQEQLFLPGMENFLRAMPNHLARASLFAPVAHGPRKFHRQAELVSRADAVITYTGQQLDEADADLTLQLLYRALDFPLGAEVSFQAASFLRELGRGNGKTQYQWLNRRLKALAEATLFVEGKTSDGTTKFSVGAAADDGIGNLRAFRILAELSYDMAKKEYVYVLDPRWRILFENREFALVDWDKRKQIGRNQDMAKSLQRLVATSSDLVQRYALDWLKERMVYGGRLRDFEVALVRSIRELERLEIIAAGRIEVSTKGKRQAVWTRLAQTTTQQSCKPETSA